MFSLQPQSSRANLAARQIPSEKLKRLEQEQKRNREELVDKYTQLVTSINQWDTTHSEAFHTYLNQESIKIIPDDKISTANDTDITKFIKVTKLFIEALQNDPKFKASDNNELLNSLRIINGEQIVDAPTIDLTFRYSLLINKDSTASGPDNSTFPKINKKSNNQAGGSNEKNLTSWFRSLTSWFRSLFFSSDA